MNSRQLNIILGLLVVLLFGVIFFLLITRTTNLQTASNIVSQDQKINRNNTLIERSPTQTEVSQSDEKLRTYTNTVFGYTVDFPESYDLPEPEAKYARFVSNKGVVEINVREASMNINDGTGKQTPIEFKDYSYMDFIRSGEGKLGGQVAAIFKAPRGYCDGPSCSDPFIAYSTDKPVALYYNVVFYGDDILSSDEEKILESFQFKYKD